MKALTVRQPWAQLLVTGIKHIETRPRRAPTSALGQRIAITASARAVERGHVGEWCIDRNRRDGAWMRRHTLDPSTRLPRGMVVGSGVLTASIPMHDNAQCPGPPGLGYPPHLCLNATSAEPDKRALHVTWLHDTARNVADQLPYGDFAPGRWAWLFDDVAPIEERCPACWGTGLVEPRPGDPDDLCERVYCYVCIGKGTSSPVPVRGQLGIWTWRP